MAVAIFKPASAGANSRAGVGAGGATNTVAPVVAPGTAGTVGGWIPSGGQIASTAPTSSGSGDPSVPSTSPVPGVAAPAASAPSSGQPSLTVPSPFVSVPIPNLTGGGGGGAGTGGGGYTGPGTATVAPAGPQTQPSGQITLSPGYTPDYGTLLQTDPAYVAAQNASTAAQQTADAQRRAAVRSAYVQYGGQMPAGWTDTYGDIDQATKDAAAANQFSTQAQLKNNYTQSAQQLRASLAARGMLQSGDLNYGQDQLDQGYGQQQYDAANTFGTAYNGALGAYAGVLGQNAQSMDQAVQAAESNVESNPAYRPVAAQTANYDPASSAKYGTTIYVGPDGSFYTANGQPFYAPGSQA